MSKRTEVEASEAFRVALQDLTFNSKPIITGLTVKARENVEYARSIVRVIEDHFVNAPLNFKLPCLYLIDSIVKNLGQPFIDLFGEHIADKFCSAYTALTDEKTRREFLRVYGLWNGVFSDIHLRDIEERLRLRKSKRTATHAMPPSGSSKFPNMPPNQYSIPLPPPSGYVVPGSLPSFAQHAQPQLYPQPPPVMYGTRMSPGAIGILVQIRNILMAPRNAFPPNIIPDLIYRLGAGAELDPNILRDLDSRCRFPDVRPALDLLNYLLNPPSPIVTNPYPIASPDIIASVGPHVTRTESPVNAQQPKLNTEHAYLYSDRPKQCKVCGIRFLDDETGRDAYATHLDAHFRRNMKLRDRSKKVLVRDWLQSSDEWSTGILPGASEKQVPVFFEAMIKTAREESNHKDIGGSVDESSSPSMVKIGNLDRDQRCSMCGEQLEISFDNDQDEWMFMDAAEVDGELYHKTCSLLMGPVTKKSKNWTVVLSSDDAKQVVLYNQKDKQLAVKSSSSPLLSSIKLRNDDEQIAVCSMCKRPFESHSYVYKNYFRVLEDAFESNTFKKSSQTQSKIPKTSIITGYYQQFFIELGKVGRGGGGSVFVCDHVLNGTVLGRYAVKKVPVGDDNDWLTRLLHEVHMLEAMRHDNVIEYRHSWLEEWQPSPFAPKVPHLFILMEYAEEGSLEQALQSSKSTHNQEDWIRRFVAMAKGLEHLHSRGILHRDLKPSNILLKRDQNTREIIPMISDFGEARSSNVLERDRTGATGTIEYTAPELLQRDSNGSYFNRHSTASDIWSLGMIFYQCIYRCLPFENVDDYDTLHNQLQQLTFINIPSRPNIPSPLRALIKAMLSIDPENRPTILSVIEILTVLSPEENEGQGKLLPPTFTPVSLDRPASASRRHDHMGRYLELISHKRALYYMPVLIALIKYFYCYPKAVPWTSLLVDIIMMQSCIYFKLPLLSLLGAILTSIWFYFTPHKCCSNNG